MNTAGSDVAANSLARNVARATTPLVVRPPAVGANRRLLTLQEAAMALSVSVPSVRRLIATCHLPCVRFNRRLLIDIKDLDQFIARSKQSA